METLAEKCEQLKKEYINGVTDRFSNIVCSLEQLEQEPANFKALKNLMHYFYGFSSTGTTYGFPHVTLLGHKGENECETLLKGNLSPNKHDIERWRNYLLELKKEFSN